MEKGILEKTGKSLAEWVAIVKKGNFTKHGEIVKFLKTEYGFTYGYANFVALKSLKIDAGSADPEELIAAQYRGKEALKPIYAGLLEKIHAFGQDIEIVPKKASVSLRRKKQFALIQPSTKTRIDLGLKLRGKEPAGRLESSGPFGAMCTHRVQLSELSEIDDELLGWLREAYEQAC